MCVFRSCLKPPEAHRSGATSPSMTSSWKADLAPKWTWWPPWEPPMRSSRRRRRMHGPRCCCFCTLQIPDGGISPRSSVFMERHISCGHSGAAEDVYLFSITFICIRLMLIAQNKARRLFTIIVFFLHHWQPLQSIFNSVIIGTDES
ncbi:hypothetical protein EYF80_062975 [Liparis tanakae]|uniref:Uncharacterized protein n=1 Tax=Liparis tanakae TaxID=230148 RepID=A0A4Z2EDE0_9TELE|nr:hypothetical protein EYF80_062975 [Liparis tanakae]